MSKNYFKKLVKIVLRGVADTYETLNNFTPPRKETSLIGWSIVVITDGKNNSLISKLIISVEQELNGSPYEIIIVGPPSLNLKYLSKNIPIRIIPYKELRIPGVTGWITKKKNIGIFYTKFNKVAVCHDYIVFKPGWKRGYDKFEELEEFEVCTNVLIDMDNERSTDWITWDYPKIGQAFLPYAKHANNYQYICGIYFVAKRDFLLKNPLDESLRWAEAEDIEWSKKIREKTTFKINTLSVVQFSKPKWKMTPEWIERSKQLKDLLESNKA